MRLCGFADKLDIIRNVQYVPATKVAFHCREPFWEREGIGGGASCAGGQVRQTYYPDVDGDRALGAVLLASYTIGDDAEVLGRMPASQRHAAVLAELTRMHPQLCSPGMIVDAASMAWGRNRWSGSGCSVRWGKNAAEREDERLAVARPVGPLFFAGEHCSSAPAWIDGAIQSAVDAVGQLVLRDSRTAAAEEPSSAPTAPAHASLRESVDT
jgi:monoamine oxidase